MTYRIMGLKSQNYDLKIIIIRLKKLNYNVIIFNVIICDFLCHNFVITIHIVFSPFVAEMGFHMKQPIMFSVVL